MAQRSKKKAKPKKTAPNKELSNKIRHLQVLLEYTLKSVDGQSESLDALFLAQADKINKQINELGINGKK